MILPPTETEELPAPPVTEEAIPTPPVMEEELFDLEIDPSKGIQQEKPTGQTATASVSEQQAASAAKMFRSVLNFMMPAGLSWYSKEDASRYKMSNSEAKEFEDLCKDYLLTINSAPSPTALFILGVAALLAGKGMQAHSDKRQRLKRESAEREAKKQRELLKQPKQEQEILKQPKQEQETLKQPKQEQRTLEQPPSIDEFPELYNRRPNFQREGVEYVKPVSNNRKYRKDEKRDIVSQPMLSILQRVEAATAKEAAGRGWDEKKIQTLVNQRAKKILRNLQTKHGITENMLI